MRNRFVASLPPSDVCFAKWDASTHMLFPYEHERTVEWPAYPADFDTDFYVVSHITVSRLPGVFFNGFVKMQTADCDIIILNRQSYSRGQARTTNSYISFR